MDEGTSDSTRKRIVYHTNYPSGSNLSQKTYELSYEVGEVALVINISDIP